MPKGNDKIIFTLNQLLVMELTGIQQYLVNRARYLNLQLSALVAYIDERIADEQRHYQLLLDRVFYLQGAPLAGRFNPINIQETIDGTFLADQASETQAIAAYNDAIRKAAEAGDDGTRALLEAILKDEEDHLNDLEAKLAQLTLTGLPVFIGEQL